MSRVRLIVLTACAVALASVVWGSVSRAETEQSGVLRVTFKGGFAPRRLPRDRPAPITVNVTGAISTADGSHPPPLRRIQVELNRAGKLSSTGLPACPSRRLQSTSSEAALAICRRSLVGHGKFQAEVSFGAFEHTTAEGKILVFNGTFRRRPALLLHLYASVPVRATLVLPLTISHRPDGRFGTTLNGKMPRLAGGLGSITEIAMVIGRRYSYRGTRRSYLSASCAAPSGLPGAVFTFARGTFIFGGEKRFHTALTRDCRVR